MEPWCANRSKRAAFTELALHLRAECKSLTTIRAYMEAAQWFGSAGKRASAEQE